MTAKYSTPVVGSGLINIRATRDRHNVVAPKAGQRDKTEMKNSVETIHRSSSRRAVDQEKSGVNFATSR